MYGWTWVGVIVVAILIEIFTDQLISIWFVPGAMVAIVLDFLEVDLVWQIFSVLIFAIVGIFLLRFLVKRNLPKSDSKTNINAIIGEKCVVTEKIDNYAGCGQVRVNGQIWSARCAKEDDSFEVGEILNIVAIEGVKLICKK